jgi:hypothetical protein|tara:strand:- start:91 stop:336 length:246 start_codon:yes stop_codon:yes gene_type:complete
MIDYVEANCIVPPLNSHPEYDEESDTWDVYFEESEGANPYELERDLVCIALDTLEEAQSLIIKSVQLYEAREEGQNEEDTG